MLYTLNAQWIHCGLLSTYNIRLVHYPASEGNETPPPPREKKDQNLYPIVNLYSPAITVGSDHHTLRRRQRQLPIVLSSQKIMLWCGPSPVTCLGRDLRQESPLSRRTLHIVDVFKTGSVVRKVNWLDVLQKLPSSILKSQIGPRLTEIMQWEHRWLSYAKVSLIVQMLRRQWSRSNGAEE